MDPSYFEEHDAHLDTRKAALRPLDAQSTKKLMPPYICNSKYKQ